MSLNVEVLEQSFDQIKPQAMEFSSTFYNNLFTDYPQVRPLFANTNMVKQRKKLLDSLVLVIENLRNGDVLADALKGLGTRHMHYGVLPEHYPMVGGAILKTFETYLGPDWTPEVEKAWVDAYEAISHLMLEGADYSKEALKLHKASEQHQEVEPASMQVSQSNTSTSPRNQNLKWLIIIGGIVALVIVLIWLFSR